MKKVLPEKNNLPFSGQPNVSFSMKLLFEFAIHIQMINNNYKERKSHFKIIFSCPFQGNQIILFSMKILFEFAIHMHMINNQKRNYKISQQEHSHRSEKRVHAPFSFLRACAPLRLRVVRVPHLLSLALQCNITCLTRVTAFASRALRALCKRVYFFEQSCRSLNKINQ